MFDQINFQSPIDVDLNRIVNSIHGMKCYGLNCVINGPKLNISIFPNLIIDHLIRVGSYAGTNESEKMV